MNIDTGPAVPGGQSNASGAVSAAAESVRTRAGEGADVVADLTAEVAGTVKEQASQVAGEAAAQARDLLGEARDQIREQAREQTGRLAENVRRLAHELQDMADHGKPDSTATAAVGQIADGGHRGADRLEGRGAEGLLEDVQGFARRRPGLFLAGAALAGFALGRTGKGVAAAGSSEQAGQPADFRPGSASAVPVAQPTRDVAGSSPVRRSSVPGPYQVYGQSQPPHVTPRYGPDAGYQPQQSPTGS
ncbi:hypothetical protein [Kitasatospora sp. MBT63]|uniref:hypothetical protein n=1 Tax=Kitasatospora sp. MBT63 TaxID=1444768 RepID=UPI00069059C9|nr:hypothetical protein [Kitasatospora sp. MBT63]